VEQACLIASELGMTLDGPPVWEGDGLHLKLGVQIAGQWKVLPLWRPNINDSHGGNNHATREVRQKLHGQVRDFLQSFVEPIAE